MGRKTAKKKCSGGPSKDNDSSADDAKRSCSPNELTARLIDLLLSSNTCESTEEAASVAEAVAEECSALEKTKEDMVIPMAELIKQYFDQLTGDGAEEMARSVLDIAADDQDEDQSSDEERPRYSSDIDEDDDEDGDDGEYIGEGECELCEREIRLTRHHLIPKSTWKKLKPRIRTAIEAMQSGQIDKARMILGGSLIDDLPPEVVENPNNAMLLRKFLSRTCNICRPCHSTVHKLHSEMELAESFSNIDKLLEDEELLKFCKWASKQKCGKYSLNHR